MLKITRKEPMTMSCYFPDYTVQYTAEPFVKTCSGTPHQLRYITVTVSGIARGGGWGGGRSSPHAASQSCSSENFCPQSENLGCRES